MFRRIVPGRVVATVALQPAIAFSQTATGTLSGIVRDGSGGAVPGAAIKVVRESATEPLEAFSDERGAYLVADLVPGAYRIDVSLDGFDTFTRRVVIDAGQVSTLDATLLPARLTEAVVVTARRIEERS